MSRLKTLGDVLVAIEQYADALTAPRPRCPDGAMRHQTRIDDRKAVLIETVRLYGSVAD